MCACVVSIHVYSECEACIFICAINIIVIAGDHEDRVTQLQLNVSTFEPPTALPQVDNSYIAGTIHDTRVHYWML